jgi:hypothetical protein
MEEKSWQNEGIVTEGPKLRGHRGNRFRITG